MRLFRIAICALLAFSVLAYGCVEEWSQAVLEISLAWLLVYWAIRQYRRRSEQLVLSPLFLPLRSLALLVSRRWYFIPPRPSITRAWSCSSWLPT